MEAATVATVAAEGGTVDGGGDADKQGGHHVARNLADEFLQVDGHEVQPTPSANLVVALNELGRLPQMPELTKATAMLKAAAVQVFEFHDNQAPSHSTRLNRSTGPHWPRSQRPGGSRFRADGPYLQ